MWTDPVVTIKQENDYAVELMKKAFPTVPTEKLAPYSIRIRTEMYATGKWPSTAELKKTYDPYLGAFETLPPWRAGVPLEHALADTRNPAAKAAE